MARTKRSPNPDCLPMQGEVLIRRAPYVRQRYRAALIRVRNSLVVALGILAGIHLIARLVDGPLIDITSLNQLSPWLFLFLALPSLTSARRIFGDYRLLRTNPLLKISDAGLLWWEAPDQAIPWRRIGGFVRRGSKLYVLEARLSSNPEYHHVLFCIDTALLKVRHVDLMAHLEARMAVQLERRIAS